MHNNLNVSKTLCNKDNNIYGMNPFIWNSRKGKTNLQWKKADSVGAQGQGSEDWPQRSIRKLLGWWKCYRSWLGW